MATDVFAERQIEATPEGTGPKPTEEHRPRISLTGAIRADDVSIRNGVIGVVAGEDVRLERGFVRTMLAEDRIEMRQAGAQSVIAAGDVSIQQGGAGAIISNGSVRLDRGGAAIALGRRIDVGERSLVIIGVAPSLQLAGGRVLVGPLAAVAAIGTLVAAMLGALRLARRRGVIQAAKR